MGEKFVKLLNADGKNIGQVQYNEVLAPERGITKLKAKGQYALIFGPKETGYAKAVTDEEALEAILAHHRDDLLKTQKFQDLKKYTKPGRNEKREKIVTVKPVKQSTSGSLFVYISASEAQALDVVAGDYVTATFARAYADTPANPETEEGTTETGIEFNDQTTSMYTGNSVEEIIREVFGNSKYITVLPPQGENTIEYGIVAEWNPDSAMFYQLGKLYDLTVNGHYIKNADTPPYIKKAWSALEESLAANGGEKNTQRLNALKFFR